MFDLTKASSSSCSTSSDQTSRFDFPFSGKRYAVVTTPTNEDLDDSYLELSFVTRLLTYLAVSVFLLTIVILILKCLKTFDVETNTSTDTIQTAARDEHTETTPIMVEENPVYGTVEREETEVDIETASYSSSEDVYNAKLCVICYDEQRNCFFVPCGHCATCYGCAQRIMAAEGKVCPICRRALYKVRKLVNL